MIGKETKPDMVFGTTKHFRMSFGTPPTVERKKFEVDGGRKRKPVSFFDPHREKTILSYIEPNEPEQNSSNIEVETKPKKVQSESEQNQMTVAPLENEREPKLFVDVNVANFGMKRIVVYEGDTVDSLVEDFVKTCPIDEPMVERLKELLKKQMDGVLDAIVEDDDNHEEEEEGFHVRESEMMDQPQVESASAEHTSEGKIERDSQSETHFDADPGPIYASNSAKEIDPPEDLQN